ncbi:hypothetical protein [Corynebacterium hindlerae]|uniref:hypothetical protein n=1 Tax=Corynebacterium hindlerae TaxID=699041 RepID=UPI0031B6E7AB
MTVTITPVVTLPEAKQVWNNTQADEHWQLVHHEYIGITFRVVKKRTLLRTSETCVGRIQVLVDPVTHHVVTCDQWDEREATPNVVADEHIVTRARQIVAPIVMRKLKLMANFGLEVDHYEPRVLKPNWLVTNKRLQGLVDGLTGQLAVRETV